MPVAGAAGQSEGQVQPTPVGQPDIGPLDEPLQDKEHPCGLLECGKDAAPQEGPPIAPLVDAEQQPDQAGKLDGSQKPEPVAVTSGAVGGFPLQGKGGEGKDQEPAGLGDWKIDQSAPTPSPKPAAVRPSGGDPFDAGVTSRYSREVAFGGGAGQARGAGR